jgi:hypothetical protein
MLSAASRTRLLVVEAVYFRLPPVVEFGSKRIRGLELGIVNIDNPGIALGKPSIHHSPFTIHCCYCTTKIQSNFHPTATRVRFGWSINLALITRADSGSALSRAYTPDCTAQT